MNEVKISINGINVEGFAETEVILSKPVPKTILSYCSFGVTDPKFWMITFMMKRLIPVIYIMHVKPTKRQLRRMRRKIRKQVKL